MLLNESLGVKAVGTATCMVLGVDTFLPLTAVVSPGASGRGASTRHSHVCCGERADGTDGDPGLLVCALGQRLLGASRIAGAPGESEFLCSTLMAACATPIALHSV
jgi:hypothetical protein